MVAVGDLASGFDRSVGQVWGDGRAPRLGTDKLGRWLDKLPKRPSRIRRNEHFTRSCDADSRAQADEQLAAFAAIVRTAKYPQAAACPADDLERLFTSSPSRRNTGRTFVRCELIEIALRYGSTMRQSRDQRPKARGQLMAYKPAGHGTTLADLRLAAHTLPLARRRRVPFIDGGSRNAIQEKTSTRKPPDLASILIHNF